MLRWVGGCIRVAGSCLIACPLALCYLGGGSWWVCGYTLGLLSFTVTSGYITWSIISQILHNSDIFSNFKSWIFGSFATSSQSVCSSLDDVLEREISLTAQVFHSHLILPWYAFISPDEKYSFQVRNLFEDILKEMCGNARKHVNASHFLREVTILYIQHYRNFFKALQKVAKKRKEQPINCRHSVDEIASCFRPKHPALHADGEGVKQHLRQLSQLLLMKYLNFDVSHCFLILVSLRDIIAHNLLIAIFDSLSDYFWLSSFLVSFTCGDLIGKGQDKALISVGKGEKHMGKLIMDESINLFSTPGICEISIDKARNFLSVFADSSTTSLRNGATTLCNPLRSAHSESSLSPPEGENECSRVYKEFPDMSSIINNNMKRSVVSALGGMIPASTIPALSVIGEEVTLVSQKMWKSPDEENNADDCSDFSILSSQELKDILLPSHSHDEDHSCMDGSSVKHSDMAQKDRDLDKRIYFNASRSRSFNCLRTKVNNEGENCELSYICSASIENVSLGNENFDYAKVNNSFSSDVRKRVKGHLRKVPSFDRCDSQSLSLPHSLIFSSKAIPVDGFQENPDSSLETSPAPPEKIAKLSSAESSRKDDIVTYKPMFPAADEKVSQNLDISTENGNENKKPPCEGNRGTFDLDEGMETDVEKQELKDIAEEEIFGSDKNEHTSKDPFEVSNVSSQSSAQSKDCSKGFGWENQDLSPIYEESENLASTIAKLRCLLSERQSQRSLGSLSSFGSSESEPRSAHSDPGKYIDRTRFSFLHKDHSSSITSVKSVSSTDSSQLLSTSDEDIVENAEIVWDGKIFNNISICSTELQSDPVGFQFTVYIVQYEAVYQCDVGVAPTEEIIATDACSPDPKIVLQTNFVKRRFREFLSLHSAIEEDPSLRGAMKGIKGPNKWLNLPFSKLDTATISSRKLFLERYLQALIQRPLINASVPLKNFLSYATDSSSSAGKKPLDVGVPRFDKILARTVTGVFNSLKTALPSFESTDSSNQSHANISSNPSLSSVSSNWSSFGQDGLSVKRGTASFARVEKEVDGGCTGERKTFELSVDITAEEEVCKFEELLMAALCSTSNSSSEVDCSTAHELLYRAKSPVKFSSVAPYCSSFVPPTLSFPFRPPVGSSGKEYSSPKSSSNWLGLGFSSRLLRITREESLGEERDLNSLALLISLLDASIEVLSGRDHPLSREGASLLLASFLDGPLSSHFQDRLDSFVREELVVLFFTHLRKCCSAVSDDFPQTQNISLEESRKLFVTSLYDCIPDYIKKLLGEDCLREAIGLISASFEHPIMGQDLALQILDLAVGHLLLKA